MTADTATIPQYDPKDLSDLLPLYYQMLFPTKQFFKWLSYGNVNKSHFENREFSFTLAGDIYIRYQSFSNEVDLKNALMQKVPEKIDIGCVFNMKPPDVKKGLGISKAEERELVFDIDMTDYDEVRTCCQGADLCKKCWPFLAIAAKVLDAALRNDFGFKHLLWVYSGRRGIHCWVCDENARKLGIEGRTAIAEYLTLVEGGQFQKKKVSLDKVREAIHPHVTRSLMIVERYFNKLIIEDQQMMATPKRQKEIVELCTNVDLKKRLIHRLEQTNKLEEKWNEIEAETKGYLKEETRKVATLCKNYIAEVKLQYCYPRLDINVTKGINHLLKAPFCIHPKTGRVCIPFDVNKVDSFNPKDVPTVKELVDQLKANEDVDGKATSKTALKNYIGIFDTFIRKLEEENREVKLKERDIKMEF